MDETPIHVHMDRIIDLLKQQERLSLTELFTPPRTRGRLLGLFLATLELIKGCVVGAEQPEVFGGTVAAFGDDNDGRSALARSSSHGKPRKALAPLPAT